MEDVSVFETVMTLVPTGGMCDLNTHNIVSRNDVSPPLRRHVGERGRLFAGPVGGGQLDSLCITKRGAAALWTLRAGGSAVWRAVALGPTKELPGHS